LPVRPDELVVERLEREDLKDVCAQSQWCVLIKGEGGVGKTTLAIQIALWASSQERETGEMLPLLVEPGAQFDIRRDISVFKKELRGHLGLLLASETAVPEDLFDQLLKSRRIVVILDGVSEMVTSVESDGSARRQHPDFGVNALVVTSRSNEPGFMADLTLEPMRIDSNHLLPFMNAYLAEAGATSLTDYELFDASRRLAKIAVSGKGINPLLARLFAEQIAALQQTKGQLENLPKSLPDLILGYLNVLNRRHSDDQPDDRVVHAAAKVCAWACIGLTLRAGEAVPRDRLVEALIAEQIEQRLLDDLETRLQVVRSIGAARALVRFEMDPVEEYLGALFLIDRNGEDEAKWREFLCEVDAKTGAPRAVRSFIGALADCVASGPTSSTTDWVLQELRRRCGNPQEEPSGDPSGDPSGTVS